jgi:hypothetical protein
MPLPTRSNVETLDYSGAGQPAAYLEAKTLTPSSYTLDYSGYAQPVVGLPAGTPPPPTQNSNFLVFLTA